MCKEWTPSQYCFYDYVLSNKEWEICFARNIQTCKLTSKALIPSDPYLKFSSFQNAAFTIYKC